jgi:Phage integrase family
MSIMRAMLRRWSGLSRRRRHGRLHGLRHTHGTLLISAGVPVKVVSERLGHATPGFTIDTYQHVLPCMQAEAARVFEQLVGPPADRRSENSEKTREKRRGRRPEDGGSPGHRVSGLGFFVAGTGFEPVTSGL